MEENFAKFSWNTSDVNGSVAFKQEIALFRRGGVVKFLKCESGYEFNFVEL
jgi:hypothetical protein